MIINVEILRLRPRNFAIVGSSPQKGKVDLCMTNGSKVLIYLNLLYFLLHYLQEYSKIMFSKQFQNKLNSLDFDWSIIILSCAFMSFLEIFLSCAMISSCALINFLRISCPVLLIHAVD